MKKFKIIVIFIVFCFLMLTNEFLNQTKLSDLKDYNFNNIEYSR